MVACWHHRIKALHPIWFIYYSKVYVGIWCRLMIFSCSSSPLFSLNIAWFLVLYFFWSSDAHFSNTRCFLANSDSFQSLTDRWFWVFCWLATFYHKDNRIDPGISSWGSHSRSLLGLFFVTEVKNPHVTLYKHYSPTI